MSVTLNSYRHFSHEFAFDYQRTQFKLVQLASVTQNTANFQPQDAGVATAQFGYNLMFNFNRRERRWSPYIAAGPALQLAHLSNSPLKTAPVYFKFALQNIGILSAAYDFGSTPPLQGGGIFQPALQYGGGAKVRVSRRWLWRADFRETLTSEPNFWAKAVGAIQKDFRSDPTLNGWTVTQTKPAGGILRQGRFTTGFSFVF